MTSSDLKTLLQENSISQSQLAKQMSKKAGYVSLVNRWLRGSTITYSSEIRIKMAIRAINKKRQRVKDKVK